MTRRITSSQCHHGCFKARWHGSPNADMRQPLHASPATKPSQVPARSNPQVRTAPTAKLTHVHILLIRHNHSSTTEGARYMQISSKTATKRTRVNNQNNLPRLFFYGTVRQFHIMAQCRAAGLQRRWLLRLLAISISISRLDGRVQERGNWVKAAAAAL